MSAHLFTFSAVLTAAQGSPPASDGSYLAIVKDPAAPYVLVFMVASVVALGWVMGTIDKRRGE